MMTIISIHRILKQCGKEESKYFSLSSDKGTRNCYYDYTHFTNKETDTEKQNKRPKIILIRAQMLTEPQVRETAMFSESAYNGVFMNSSYARCSVTCLITEKKNSEENCLIFLLFFLKFYFHFY